MKTLKIPGLLVFLAVAGIAGCGPSQSDLRKVNLLLEQSKTADCTTIHSYLNQIQTVIQSKIK